MLLNCRPKFAKPIVTFLCFTMNKIKPNLRTVYGIIIFLSMIGIAIVTRRIVKILPIIINGYQPHAIQDNPQLEALANTDDIFARYPILTLVHIVPGLVFLLLAPFQFSKKIRNGNKRKHRRSGRLVIVIGLITGVTAFTMSIAMPSIGGVNQAAATLMFSIFFLYSLLKAWQKAIRRDLILHREWMIRAYAIGLAITTIRPIVGAFFATSRLTGLTPYEFFGTAFWIGFVLHLVVAEAWLYRTRVSNPMELI